MILFLCLMPFECHVQYQNYVMSDIMSDVKSIVLSDDKFNAMSDVISDVFLGIIFELKIRDKK